MILSIEKIEELCGRYPALIAPYDKEENMNNPAGVQLHLGKCCYCSNTPKKLHNLTWGSEIEIKPNTIFLFETMERFNIPKNLSGRMSLKMGLVSRGLIMPNQTTVDPGYSNVLFGMLYNLSSEPVILKYGQAITTLELMETMESQSVYRGKVGRMTFERFVKDRVGSSLGNLEKSLTKTDKKMKKNFKLWQWGLSFLAVALTVFSIIVGITSLQPNSELTFLEGEYSELMNEFRMCEDIMKEQEKMIEELEKKVDNLESIDTKGNKN